MEKIQLLALSGSLRKASFNTIALKALTRLAPDFVQVSIFCLKDIPLFNPDREEEYIDSVSGLKAMLQLSDGLVIASPEYAHGVTGVLKNALDWLVSGDEFINKSIMLINTSPRASHAQASLKEILMTMSGNLIESAQVTLPLLGRQPDVNDVLSDTDITHSLNTALCNFCEKIVSNKSVF